MSVVDFLKKLPDAFNADAAAGADLVLQFKASSPVYATVKDGTCSVTEGEHDDPTVTIIMEDNDLMQLLTGELNGMTAFMSGQLQVEGDMMAAQQIGAFFDQEKLSA